MSEALIPVFQINLNLLQETGLLDSVDVQDGDTVHVSFKTRAAAEQVIVLFLLE